jgi:hypothetical protein
MKTFSQFMMESGGSPYQPYKPKPQPEPSAPPAGWKEKYLEPLKKKSPKLAEDAGSGNYKTYERERMRRKHDVPSPSQINKERKLAYMLQKDLPPPSYKSRALF